MVASIAGTDRNELELRHYHPMYGLVPPSCESFRHDLGRIPL